jgi:hypothetical protein
MSQNEKQLSTSLQQNSRKTPEEFLDIRACV